MRLSFKVIAYLWLGLLLIIGGLLFRAYTNLRPETFVALLTEQVQKNYPGANLEFGKIDYRFSLDFNLNLKNISLRRNGKLLASLGEVELKVPWWLLIVNQGNAQINLTKLNVYVDHNVGHEIKKDKEKAKENTPSKIEVSLPGYLADAKFTLRAKDVTVKDIHDDRRYFRLSKLLVREFQYGKNSAYELNIPVSIHHHNLSLNSDLWLFGDVTPNPEKWKLNFRGEFRVGENSERFQLEDLVIAGATEFKPEKLDINSQIEILFEKKVVGAGKLLANQDKLDIDLSLTKFPVSYFAFIYDDIKNPFLEKLTGEADGNFKLDKDLNSGLTDLNGKLAFDGDFLVSKNFSYKGKWQISFQENRYEVSFMSPKAEVSFFRRSVVDVTRNQVSQFNQEIGFTGLEMNQVLEPIKTLPAFTTELFPSYFRTSISYKECTIGQRVLDASFRYGFTPDQKFYQAKLSEGDKKLEVNYVDKKNKRLHLSATNFEWDKNLKFLSPLFEAETALIDGTIDGEWSSEWISGKWLSELSFQKLTNLNGEFVTTMNKGLSYLNLVNFKSENIAMKFSAKNNVLTLKSLELSGAEEAKITGTLNNHANKKSVLTLNYPKNKKLKAVKKEISEKFWNKENHEPSL